MALSKNKKIRISEIILLVLLIVSWLYGMALIFFADKRMDGTFWLYISIMITVVYGIFRKFK